ncbi:MAG: peptidoglycan synthetase [Bacteroidales bacterium]|nr:peptidoglycan synthetase [Bacteroidales bacterium]
MRIHFIAIGGSAMHNLAIALKAKGYEITGSDDEIFEPSLSRLKTHGLLPRYEGWNPEIITASLDAIVLGMHARADNPELLKAKELGIKIYSYPEYLYEQAKNKTRIVIGGSHGKTTITSMIMHVLKQAGIGFDYMVGAQLDGFENMVAFSNDTQYAVFEGDEYLTSPIDRRPKFHVYKPNIAVISGIAWDHINVFPTFDNYKEQFAEFINCIEPNGTLIYCNNDPEVVSVVKMAKRTDINYIAYNTPEHTLNNQGTYSIQSGQQQYPLKVIGRHNMQNIEATKTVCNLLGVKNQQFYPAIGEFKGAAKRLQCLAENEGTKIFLDFAHSPSKVSATIKAVSEAFPHRDLIACFELHTFSSLTKEFLNQYNGTLSGAAKPIVYYNPHTIEHKQLQAISPEEVRSGFGNPSLDVYTDSSALIAELNSINWKNKNLLIMTSGNFSGVNLAELATKIAQVDYK